MREQLKLVGFAAAICLVCSIILACLSRGLQERQEMNQANDIKKKVLSVFGLEITDTKGKLLISQQDLDSLFSSSITSIVLDGNGNVVPDKNVSDLLPEEINKRDKATGLKQFYPLYIFTDQTNDKKRYGIHVSGKGLWSTVKGYMALEDDLDAIAGLVIYEHQETPGLGGEIEKPDFQDGFADDKHWLDQDGKVQRFRIVKPGSPIDRHSVDGVTAATMTCRGVEAFLNEDFIVYNKYFEKAGLRN